MAITITRHLRHLRHKHKMLFFKQKQNSSSVVRFLNEADDALTTAYYQKDVRAIVNYMSRDLLDYISEELHTYEDLTSGLGLKKYRIREWNILRDENDIIIVIKSLTHKNVKIKGKIAISIGDNKREQWEVHRYGAKFLVTNIRHLEV